ncbi:MAG: hypothetical protein LIO65_04655 [Odoribacter sp.]|nr:hypothetical protein [Odoribacter sp.]
MKVNYNANFTFSFADLSDYNLMNSYEKLTYEKLAGRYGSLYDNGDFQSDDVENVFYERMKNVKRGVNSYWLSEPLRFAFTHRHNLFLEGGDESMRYGVGVSYGKTEGIMKESNRDVVNGNIRLIYRKGNLSFANNLNLDFILAEEEAIPFSRFARTNPYYPKVNEFGESEMLLEAYEYYYGFFQRGEANQYNPLYDSNNNNEHKTSTFGFINNFEVDWRIVDAVRARGKVGLTKTHAKEEKFLSPFNSDFQSTDILKRGSYYEANVETFNYDLEANLTYGKLLAEKHMVNAVGGGRFTQNSYIKSKYQVEGFVDDDKKNPSFGMGYQEGKTADYIETKRRTASYYLNVGYAYDNRYLLDANFRSDGSSVFGSNKQFSTTWSVGLGWNIHNEYFFDNIEGISLLKLRASIGNPGNQNFSDYVSMLVYEYNNHNRNPFGSSVIVRDFGNSNLKWQKQ